MYDSGLEMHFSCIFVVPYNLLTIRYFWYAKAKINF